MTVRKKSSEFLFDGQDMEQMEPSGEGRSFWQIMGFTRLGSIQPFVQVGGDISAKEGWRIAVSLIWQNTGSLQETLSTVQKLGLCTEQECKVLVTMAQRKINAVTSTSAGRLFDGVSAILGIRKASTFEGEASTALEFAAEEWRKSSRGIQKRIIWQDGQFSRKE